VINESHLIIHHGIIKDEPSKRNIKVPAELNCDKVESGKPCIRTEDVKAFQPNESDLYEEAKTCWKGGEFQGGYNGLGLNAGILHDDKTQFDDFVEKQAKTAGMVTWALIKKECPKLVIISDDLVEKRVNSIKNIICAKPEFSGKEFDATQLSVLQMVAWDLEFVWGTNAVVRRIIQSRTYSGEFHLYVYQPEITKAETDAIPDSKLNFTDFKRVLLPALNQWSDVRVVSRLFFEQKGKNEWKAISKTVNETQINLETAGPDAKKNDQPSTSGSSSASPSGNAKGEQQTPITISSIKEKEPVIPADGTDVSTKNDVPVPEKPNHTPNHEPHKSTSRQNGAEWVEPLRKSKNRNEFEISKASSVDDFGISRSIPSIISEDTNKESYFMKPGDINQIFKDEVYFRHYQTCPSFEKMTGILFKIDIRNERTGSFDKWIGDIKQEKKLQGYGDLCEDAQIAITEDAVNKRIKIAESVYSSRQTAEHSAVGAITDKQKELLPLIFGTELAISKASDWTRAAMEIQSAKDFPIIVVSQYIADTNDKQHYQATIYGTEWRLGMLPAINAYSTIRRIKVEQYRPQPDGTWSNDAADDYYISLAHKFDHESPDKNPHSSNIPMSGHQGAENIIKSQS
jgi:hypothetical protein